MEKKKVSVSLLLTLVYAAITLIAVLHHEIWRDEAQVWMLCEYLSLPELIKHLHNEGHPSLFYILLMPFAKLTGNIIYQQLICWLFMCGAAFLIIHKSPFNPVVKTAILTSAGFLYFLPVMARNYALIPFLVLSAAILYKKRKERPILYSIVIFLIANTHAIMFGFASILALLFLIETIQDKQNFKKRIFAFGIMFTGLMLLILQVYDTTSTNVFINSPNQTNVLFNLFKVPFHFFLNSIDMTITENNYMPAPFIALSALFLLVATFVSLFVFLFNNNKKLFLVCFTGILFQFLIYIFLYGNDQYVTRIFSAYIIFVFVYYVLLNENNLQKSKNIVFNPSVLLSLLFFLTSYNGITGYIADLKYPYSGAKDTGEYIKNNVDEKTSLIVIVNEISSASLAYYLDNYKLLSAARNTPFKFVVWDENSGLLPDNNVVLEFCKFYEQIYNDIYIIYPVLAIDNKNTKNFLDNNFKLEYTSSKSLRILENFTVYKYERKHE